MKRISTGVVLLALMPGITEAYYSCFRSQVHYSPYAFSYRHSSGLVSGDVRYTPYAFDYRNSGLIYDYGYSGGYGYRHPIFHGYYPRAIDVARRTSSVAWSRAQRAPQTTRPQTCPTNGTRPSRPCRAEAGNPAGDGMAIIRQHLRAKGFDAPHINRILRIDNQLLSVDFILKDRNVLIKYWNPLVIEQLDAKAGFKQKAYAKYKQDWESFAEQYKQAGGEIYTVNASEPQTIVAALDSCPKLETGNDAQTQPVLYAKQ
jgi:hypothetical protein